MTAKSPVYAENGISLYHGDCADVLPTLGMQADLVVTSPPYDDIREYGGHGYDFYRCAGAIASAVKAGGVIAWHTNDAIVEGSYTGSSFRAALHFMDELGLRLHDRIFLHKDGYLGAMASDRWYQNTDFVWIFSRGKPTTFNPIADVPGKQTARWRVKPAADKSGDFGYGQKMTHVVGAKWRRRDCLWQLRPGLNRMGAFARHWQGIHPAPMQLRLALDLITAYSNPGDLLLDPFSGSGTTALAARMLGRKAVGVEIHRPYIEDAIATRLAQQPLVEAT